MYVPTPAEVDSPSPKTEIEVVTEAYERALSVAVSNSLKMGAIQLRADSLEAKIPALQERSETSLREMYKMQRGRVGIIEMLLGSESLDEFVQQTEYLESIGRANVTAVNDLKDAKARLETMRVELEEARAESEAAMRVASEMLDSARAARAERAAEGQRTADAEGAVEDVSDDASGVSPDGADWYQTEEEFIEEWAPRIDAYLAGSPLEGQGASFARQSWRYCVDPRWSPAISNTESSKGQHCIRPHNAWGWGAADSDPYALAAEWDTWEEAIEAHVRGLANGYGYTITKAGAAKYCSSPDSWYESTRAQMEQI